MSGVMARTWAEEGSIDSIAGLQESRRHRITERFGLERTLKIILFQSSLIFTIHPGQAVREVKNYLPVANALSAPDLEVTPAGLCMQKGTVI